MNTREAQRRGRVEKVKNSIIAATSRGLSVNYEKLIAMLMVEEGLSRRVAKESVDCLINYGFCSNENGELKYNQLS